MDRKPGKTGNGFTLVEAIVVAAIIAVLAAIAIPLYTGYVRDAKIDSARSCCELVGAAVIQTNNRGIDIAAGNPWPTIGISDPSDENWDYSFGALLGTAAMDNTYAITATGKGSMAGTTGTFKPKATGSGRWTVN